MERSPGPNSNKWQFEVFAQGGFVPAYKVYVPGSPIFARVDLEFYSLGCDAGMRIGDVRGRGPLRGRGEMMFELMPFWLGRYPAQSGLYEDPGYPTFPNAKWSQKEEIFPGASITPLLLRWNFTGEQPLRLIPWMQLGGGLLWTTHNFPDGANGTSVFNFTPQLGAGVNVFRRPNQSLDFAVKVIHISNAGLGDHNPGLNQTLQFSAGYSWWK
ncbi:MAG TPA: acyloxyacyl hydrolase [Terracidiphilus sp.]|nr:acyloxyacyl hydrolase [Terracidiphilus sp.]